MEAEWEIERAEDIRRGIRGEQGRTPNDALRFYSALTHFIGVLLSVAGLVILVVLAAMVGSVWHVVGFSVYGATLVLLYTASMFYHSLPLKPRGRQILRKLDHTAIYLLIAGTYTPICLVPLRGAWGWSLFGVIWGLAIAGTIMKNVWITAPRWLSAGSYIAMGWVVIVAIYPLLKYMPGGALLWLLLGGVFYTVGGVLYALRWPRTPKADGNQWRFGSHEFFHVFVLLGSICHFFMMLQFILSLL